MILEVLKKTIDLHLHLGDVVKSIHISEADLEVLKTETENILMSVIVLFLAVVLIIVNNRE